MIWRSLVLGMALAMLAAWPASAQRGGGAWELLGEEQVGFGRDRDILRLNNDENFYRNKSYRRLRFVVTGGDVHMRTVRLGFLNGQGEEYDLDRVMKSGEQIDLDLRGERSYLRQIEMVYNAKFSLSIGGGGLRLGQPTVKVFGENVRAGGPPPPPSPPPRADRNLADWVPLATERLDRRDDSVEIRVGRREGKFGQIRLQNRGGTVNVREIRVRYGNGEGQTIRVDQEIGDGETTRRLDLEGDTRFIDRVVVILQPRRGPGQAELTLLGTERPGREDDADRRRDYEPRADLVPLGQVEVGFGADREVIRVGRDEGWYRGRDRGFDKLHIVAQGSDIYMRSIRVVYLNGQTEDYRVERQLPEGRDFVVDLPGERSYIREIELSYRKRPGYSGRAVVKVFGEPPARR
jgi:hypothetical protein